MVYRKARKTNGSMILHYGYSSWLVMFQTAIFGASRLMNRIRLRRGQTRATNIEGVQPYVRDSIISKIIAAALATPGCTSLFKLSWGE